MRMQYKLLTALGLAMLAVSGAVAETTPAAAPATATPYGYMNPFDPNWWLLTFNNMIRLTTVPLAYTAATAPAASGGAAAPSTTYPQGYLNPFDPNAWLAAAPTAAGPARAAAPAQGSPYVAMQTPYGPVYTFNYADPMAWNKLFAQPFAMPGQ
ncbi:MAG: hypothetical protein PHR30_00185 [Gallionellaceae bacterium]|nr:hypothetical protein [Gallionellaceae bacterium]